MSGLISTQGVHHLTLTVSEVARSEQFYTELFNFQKVGEFGPRNLLSNGAVVLALSAPPVPAQAAASFRPPRPAALSASSSARSRRGDAAEADGSVFPDASQFHAHIVAPAVCRAGARHAGGLGDR